MSNYKFQFLRFCKCVNILSMLEKACVPLYATVAANHRKPMGLGTIAIENIKVEVKPVTEFIGPRNDQNSTFQNVSLNAVNVDLLINIKSPGIVIDLFQ